MIPISMILILLLLAYAGLFVFAGIKSKTNKQRFGWSVLLLSPVLLLVWDMPVGYLKFKSLCESEGGLKVNKEPIAAQTLVLGGDSFYGADAADILRRHKGLRTVVARELSVSAAEFKFHIYQLDGTGKVTSQLAPDSATQVKAAQTDSDQSTSTYWLSKTRESLFPRIVKEQWSLEAPSGVRQASWTRFTFSWTDPQQTLLGRTAIEQCFFTGTVPHHELIKLISH